MLSTVLVSKSLINSAKINKIYEEYRTFNNSIKMFYDTYDCNAGDCKPEQIADLVTASAGMSLNTVAGGACFTDNTAANGSFVSLKTNVIESITKRSCQFIELQLAGFITGIDPKYITLTDSIAGKNIPYAKFNKIGAWDFRYIPSGGFITVSDSYAFPQELAYISSSINRHQLTLVGANTATGNNYDLYQNSGVACSAGSCDSIQKYGLTASVTQKLDSKFDDGLPYAGNIVGGRNAAEWSNNKISCNNVVTPATVNANMTSSVLYLNSNSIPDGCLVSFMVDLPSS